MSKQPKNDWKRKRRRALRILKIVREDPKLQDALFGPTPQTHGNPRQVEMFSAATPRLSEKEQSR